MKATVITRSIAATPNRTALECWGKICAILAPDAKSAGRKELEKVSGLAASLIASESPTDDAFFVYGSGPQVRIYCVFGEDSISGDGVDENSLLHDATDGDWQMSMPCLAEDLEWVQKKLKSLSTRITARAAGEDVEYENADDSMSDRGMILNLNEFRRL